MTQLASGRTSVNRVRWQLAIIPPLVGIVFWPVPASWIVAFPKTGLLILCVIGILLIFEPDRTGEPGRWSAESSLRPLLWLFVLALLVRAAAGPFVGVGLWGDVGRINGALMYVGCAVACWAASYVDDESSAWMIVYGMVVAGFLTTAYAGVQWMGKDPVNWTEGGLISSIGNPDHTASFHAMIAVACIWLACSARQPLGWRIAGAVVGTASIALVVYWYQRSAVQGVAILGLVAVAVIGTEVYRRGRKAIVITVLAAAGAILLPLFVLNVPLDRGIWDRYQLSVVAIKIWREHPLIGVGIGRMSAHFNLYRTVAEVQAFGAHARFLDEVHSLPTQLLATTGLLGFLPYVALAGTACVVSLRALLNVDRDRLDLNRLAAILALMWITQSIYSPDFVPLTVLGFLSIGLLLRRQHAPLWQGALRPSPRVARGLRSAAALALILALFDRGKQELTLTEIDSRIGREGQVQSTVRADARTDAVAEDYYRALQSIRDPVLVTRLARKLDMTSHPRAAEVALLRAVDSDSTYYESLDLLATRYREERRIPEAYVMARRETPLLPYDPYVWYRRGLLALMMADTADAKRSLAVARARAIDAQLTDMDFWKSYQRTAQRFAATPATAR